VSLIERLGLTIYTHYLMRW